MLVYRLWRCNHVPFDISILRVACGDNALIELEGDQTKVDGNVTSGHPSTYGLTTYDTSSRIHLLFPLTKESVSTNNHGERNYGSLSGGIIETVNGFE